MPSERDPLLAKNGGVNSHHAADAADDASPGLDIDSGDPNDENGDALINTTMDRIDSEVFATLRVLEPSSRTLHDGVSPLRSLEATFWDDLIHFNPGSMPHSTVVGISIGIMCGVLAYVYYTILEWLLEFLWETLPEAYFAPYVPEQWHLLWIPILGFLMALGVGLSVRYLGEPGDLSYTVQCVHDKAYIEMSHVLPMLAASQFSILGGGSLGPEAPLVAICASFAGYVSRNVFGMTQTNLIRKHTLMGMSSALAAFFGVPLGGSLFALEINNRFGIE